MILAWKSLGMDFLIILFAHFGVVWLRIDAM